MVHCWWMGDCPFFGQRNREHKDIEIAIFRKDQLYLKSYLIEWAFKKAINRELYTWGDEFLELTVHEIHVQVR